MRSIKTQLRLNNKERTALTKHAGTARHAYNWGLDYCIKKLEAGEHIPTAIDLHKILVAEVKKEHQWYYEVSKCAPQQALRNLQNAFAKFWQKHHANKHLPQHKRYHKKYLNQVKEKKLSHLSFEHELGFPQFKKKGLRDGFYLEGSVSLDTETNQIKLPRIGWVNIYEKLYAKLGENTEIKNVSISRKANDWFIAFKYEAEPVITQPKIQKTVGVDLGIKTLATLSDGTVFYSSDAFKKSQQKLKRFQRKLSRQYVAAEKRAGSKEKIPKGVGQNYQKTKLKIANIHQRISNIRLDTTHKLTTYLAKNHSRIVIEDLNVSGMVKNHNLASAILNGGFYECKRQLTYKCKWFSAELVIADRWYASSQICSCCGHRQKMPLRKRIFECEKCDNKMDRDLNASRNLENYIPSKGKKVCGEENAKFHGENQVGICEAETRRRTSEGQVCISS